MSRKRIIKALTLIFLFAPLLHGDFVRVSRPATIKQYPKRDAPILLRPGRGEEFVLAADTQTNGYYEVQLPGDGTEIGWIYRTLVRRHPGLPEGLTSTIPTDTTVVPFTSGRLEVHVIDVGQADAILIRCPDGIHEMLIDSGELNIRYRGSADEFQDYLNTHQARSNPIEIVIATHPHSDHIGNMEWVLGNYTVVRYVDNQNTYNSQTFRFVESAFARAQERSNTDYWGAQEQSVPEVDFCPREDVNAVVLRPAEFGRYNDPNDNSVIVRVEFGEDTFLFVGDAEAEAETSLLRDDATANLLDTDFLKVGHHGSHTSSQSVFLNHVTPEISVISSGRRGVGSNGRHKHPRAEIVRRLLMHATDRIEATVQLDSFNSETRDWDTIDLNRSVYATAVEGDLVFESDGQGIRRR